MINVRIQHQEVQKLTPKITVVGVGGAGSNAVNNMITTNLEGVEFVVCNTDAQALENALCENKVQLGLSVTAGLGAGAKPEVGRAAAEEALYDVIHYLDGSNMVFVTAGMGGGTGTGAAPVIARACRERGILTVGVVTKPFHFEGSHRMRLAEGGIEEMQNYVDTLIVIPNQNLFRIANERTTFAEAFQLADSVLQSGVRGVTDLMLRPGLINLDFADIRTAMQEMGKAMMGTGEASGDGRAIKAAEAAINNPLLDDLSMKGARGVIINVTGGYDMTLFEADEACNRIRDEVDPNANIIFGATFDEHMDGMMRVSVVATGIDAPAALKAPVSGGGASVGTPRAAASAASAITRPTGLSSLRMPAVAPVATARRIDEPVYAQAVPVEPATSYVAEPVRMVAQAGGGVPRGTTFNDAYIPPSPVEPEGNPAPASSFTPGPAPTVSAVSVSVASSVGSGSPAARQTSERRWSMPSFFEKITTHMRGGDSAEPMARSVSHEKMPPVLSEDRPTAVSAAPAPSFHGSALAPEGNVSQGAGSAGVPAAPAQGRLPIDAPSAPRPAAAMDDSLDIPAFLRRQAN